MDSSPVIGARERLAKGTVRPEGSDLAASNAALAQGMSKPKGSLPDEGARGHLAVEAVSEAGSSPKDRARGHLAKGTVKDESGGDIQGPR